MVINIVNKVKKWRGIREIIIIKKNDCMIVFGRLKVKEVRGVG